MKKKAQERRWKRAQVRLACPDIDMHTRLYVNYKPLPEVYSKEHLMAQVINLIRSGNLSYTRAKELSREILSIRVMPSTLAEADEMLLQMLEPHGSPLRSDIYCKVTAVRHGKSSSQPAHSDVAHGH